MGQSPYEAEHQKWYMTLVWNFYVIHVIMTQSEDDCWLVPSHYCDGKALICVVPAYRQTPLTLLQYTILFWLYSPPPCGGSADRAQTIIKITTDGLLQQYLRVVVPHSTPIYVADEFMHKCTLQTCSRRCIYIPLHGSAVYRKEGDKSFFWAYLCTATSPRADTWADRVWLHASPLFEHGRDVHYK